LKRRRRSVAHTTIIKNYEWQIGCYVNDVPKSKKRRRSSVVVKFREVSGTVWVCLEGIIIENTLKEE